MVHTAELADVLVRNIRSPIMATIGYDDYVHPTLQILSQESVESVADPHLLVVSGHND